METLIKNVILDFGHGGVDKKGKYLTKGKKHTFKNGVTVYEGELNRKLGKVLINALKMYHPYLNVVTTVDPEDPTDLPLYKRVEIAKRYPKEETLFLSIHLNASKYHNASGFEIYTYHGQSKSDIIAEAMADSLENLYTKVGIKLRYDLSDGDKDKEANFYVLRKVPGPSILIEGGFFDYWKDYKIISDPFFQADFAYRIAKALRPFVIDI